MKPLILWIDVTLECNLRCSYCDAYTYELRNTDTDDERYNKILKKLSNFDLPNTEVRICGGETTLFKHLYELLDKLIELKAKKIVLYTNGLNKIHSKYREHITLYSSFHLETPKLWRKVLQNTKGFETVYNILVREFEDYPLVNFKELKEILRNNIKVHIQYITPAHQKNVQGTLENYQKFLKFLAENNTTDVYYDKEIAEMYYKGRMNICRFNACNIDGLSVCSRNILGKGLCEKPLCSYIEYFEGHFDHGPLL